MKRKKLVGLGLLVVIAGVTAGILRQGENGDEGTPAWAESLRQKLVERFPEEAARAAAHFGLHPYRPADLPAPSCAAHGRAVVLVHGLDDPGKVWMNLAPALATQGHQVFQLLYPNDQPVHASARFFAAALGKLRAQGIAELIIVAHSMGGLVSREMLTHPKIDYTGQIASGRLPDVRGLIMVGTPNQGAEIARFRVLGEFREQISRYLLGQGHWLGWLVDGGGEAKYDLLPDSPFLTALNARPHPAGVSLSIIAGVAAPFDTSADIPTPNKGQSSEDQGRWARFLDSVAQGVGDGLVPVEATRLPGVAHQTVPGNHMSMIRNITAHSRRIPPAVPIIVEQTAVWELAPG